MKEVIDTKFPVEKIADKFILAGKLIDNTFSMKNKLIDYIIDKTFLRKISKIFTSKISIIKKFNFKKIELKKSINYFPNEKIKSEIFSTKPDNR